MDAVAIQQAIESAITESQVFLDGEGCDFSAVVISDAFQGLPPVKRQQAVLASVAPWLATGELHAFSVKTHTVKEWEDQQAALAGGLVQIQL